jgi:hypothetical protein
VARQSNAGRESSLSRNVRHHTRVSKGYAAGERAAMCHDTAARVYRMAPCHVTAAERGPRHRSGTPRHAGGAVGWRAGPSHPPSFLVGGGGDATQTG